MKAYYHIAGNNYRAGSLFSFLCEMSFLLPEYANTLVITDKLKKSFRPKVDIVANAYGLDIIFEPKNLDDGPVLKVERPADGLIGFTGPVGRLEMVNCPNIQNFVKGVTKKSGPPEISLLAGPSSYSADYCRECLKFLKDRLPGSTVLIPFYPKDNLVEAGTGLNMQPIPMQVGVRRDLLGGIRMAFFPADRTPTRLAYEYAILGIPTLDPLLLELRSKDLKRVLYDDEYRKSLTGGAYASALVNNLKYNINVVRKFIGENAIISNKQ